MKKKTDTDNNDSTKININKNKNNINTINTLSNTNKSESQYFTEKTEEKSENENNKLTISMTGTSPVITMDDGQGNKNIIKSKKGLMKFLYKIYSENQNLNNFQRQVFFREI